MNQACHMFLLKFREDLFFLLQSDTAVHIPVAHQREFILSLEAGAAKLPAACLEEGWSTGKNGQGKVYLCLEHMIGDGTEEEEI